MIIKQANIGKALKENLKQFVGRNGITSVTGEGTHLYLNTENEHAADKLWGYLITNGIITKRNGGRGVMLKPSLLFGQKHADQFVHSL